MSSDLSSDHVVKNITTEHLINPQGNVSEGSGDKSNQQDGLKSDNNLDPSRWWDFEHTKDMWYLYIYIIASINI